MNTRDFLHPAWLLVIGWWLGLSTAVHGQLERDPAAPITFSRIEEVVAQWSADRQLFLHGDLGVRPQQLQDLAQWLRIHGLHWTVILMEDAEGQTYRAADGQSFQGMDAVEHALGYGLNNQTGFA
ncbi:MAG: hypothetical protein ACK53L_10840, partial [Pirellulaceae bacterium]